MKTDENINANHIDGNILALVTIFRDINNHWIREINIEGDCFDYDSQDIYRHVLNEIFIKVELVEKINPQVQKEDRSILLEDLIKAVDNNIKLFTNHKDLFQDLPRQKLLIKEFRERKYSKSTKDDKSLYDVFTRLKETQNRKFYFNSELYESIGFLEHNFHEEIHYYALDLKRQIAGNFLEESKYDRNYLMIHDNLFFNMGVVYLIHKNYSGILFETISEIELYNVLNLQNTVQYLKIKNNEKGFYLISKLKSLIQNDLQEVWLGGILKEIGKSKKYYNSKYRTVVGSNATDDQQHFVEVLDTIFKENIKQLVS
ncbi:hypothetical protein ACFSYG_14130 [Leeuwenhoekiella polynyae]|uniref:Uncharacterized protein n=1 Tax=Leeuwenhoekiella polynyae TaxID=1550906 RepID=A0A4Q0NT33_9FLAO|nr:hypothetical protein [Leeuwenhoekiella polynyae]RXG12827.1 hypothetical protein DSM02_3831 [Leeuwenhoekiella polynyae]